MNVIYSPWMRNFLQAVHKAEQEILLVSPFIKLSLVRPLLLALPNSPISLTIVTKFTPLVFQQQASDLSALQLLLHRPVAPGPTALFKLNRLHAKVYIFDRRHIYLGSSNLSISGLDRNLEVVAAVDDPELAQQIYMDLERRGAFSLALDGNLLEEMRIKLGDTPASVIILPSPDLDTDDEDDEQIEQREALGDAGAELSAEVPIPEAEDADVREEAIRSFLSTHARPDLCVIAGVPFETGAGSPRIEDKEAWLAAATRDLERIRTYLVPALQLPEKIAQSPEATLPFIHPSWSSKFRELTTGDILHQGFGHLGADVLQLEVALYFAKQLAFDPASAALPSIATAEALTAADYRGFLESRGLHVLLHVTDVSEDVAVLQFKTIIGLQFFYQGYTALRPLLRQFLENNLTLRTIHEATQDPKTRLQELAQYHRHTPKYETTPIEDSPLHARLFRSLVRIGTRTFGPKTSQGKKLAEKAVALFAVTQLLKEKDYAEFDGKAKGYLLGRSFRRYFLSPERRTVCQQLAKALGIQYSRDVMLLDIALTHVSFWSDHPEARSYQRLAFIGAYISNVLLDLDILEARGWMYEKLTTELRHKEMLLYRSILTTLFDSLELRKVARIGGSVKDITPSIKKDIVQSIIATIFLWEGLEGAQQFWRTYIKPVFDQTVTEGTDIDPVSSLQEHIQAIYKRSPHYETKQMPRTPANTAAFIVHCYLDNHLLGTGSGQTKRAARREAAQQALSQIQKLSSEQLVPQDPEG